MPIVKPRLVSALQDATTGTGNRIDEMKSKNVPSHKAQIVDIKWVPEDFEVEKRALHHTLINKSTSIIFSKSLILSLGKERNQFVSLSEDGQILIWDIRVPGDKEIEEVKSLSISKSKREYSTPGRLCSLSSFTDLRVVVSWAVLS